MVHKIYGPPEGFREAVNALCPSLPHSGFQNLADVQICGAQSFCDA